MSDWRIIASFVVSAVCCAAAVAIPGTAFAQTRTATSAATATRSVAATPQEYDLNFTLPTAGKSGCMVCHGDKNLVRLKGDQYVSYWVDGAVLDSSAHATVLCTGCHLDFAFKAPHENAQGDDWRAVAKLACKNCHQSQFEAFGKGAHTIASAPGQEQTSTAERPLCGDCHGGHDIPMLTDNPAGQEQLHQQGWTVCGQCHEDYWDSYADYYHGRAYRNGAPDAPACWQCHGAHEIYPSSDRRSEMHETRRVETCGQCHPSANDVYVLYSGYIHTRPEELRDNPVYALYLRARSTVSGWFDSAWSVFGG